MDGRLGVCGGGGSGGACTRVAPRLAGGPVPLSLTLSPHSHAAGWLGGAACHTTTPVFIVTIYRIASPRDWVRVLQVTLSHNKCFVIGLVVVVIR